jgi:hypothetical protein
MTNRGVLSGLRSISPIADGQVLVTDSTQPSGQTYGLRAYAQGYTPGDYIPSPTQGNATVNPSTNVLLASVMRIDKATTFDRLAVYQNNAGVASMIGRLGIYSNNSLGQPGSLLLDAGSVDLSGASGLKTVTINYQLQVGVYWMAMVQQGGASYVTMQSGQWNPFKYLMTSNAPFNYGFAPPESYSMSGVTGPLPAQFTPPSSYGGPITSVGIYLRAT